MRIKNIKDLKSVGIYWSFNKESAESHWGGHNKNHIEIILVGKLTSDIIDYRGTMAARLVDMGEQEDEVRLLKGNKIYIYGFFLNDKFNPIEKFMII